MSAPKFYLEKRKDKDNVIITKNCLIRMYITIPDGRVEYSTGIRVDAKHFDAEYYKKGKEPIKVSAPNFDENNARLSALQLEALRLFNLIRTTGDNFTVKEFKEKLDYIHRPKRELETEIPSTFLDYLELITSQRAKGEKLQPSGKTFTPATIRKFKTLISSLHRYLKYTKKTDLKFEDINDSFYENYRKFCFEVESKRVSTFGGLIRDIKATLNEAKADKFINELSINKKKFIIPHYEADSIALSTDQLQKIQDLIIDDDELIKIRDLFLVGCYTALRYSDLTSLTIDKYDDSFIRVKQQKTGDYVTIPVNKQLAKILIKYKGEFPVLDINLHSYNESVREIAKLAGLDDEVTITDTVGGKKKKVTKLTYELISSHTARRTYATLMFKLGVPTFLIMAVTGHKTESSFLKYVKATNEDKARMMAEIMSKLNM